MEKLSQIGTGKDNKEKIEKIPCRRVVQKMGLHGKLGPMQRKRGAERIRSITSG